MKISHSNKTALVFGGTGLVGGHIVDHLIANHAYSNILVFTRSVFKTSHQKITNHLIDFDKPQDWHHLVKGDDIFVALGTTMAKAGSKEAFLKVDYEYVLSILNIAERNNVSQCMLVSSVGANAQSLFFYTKVKGKVEEKVKKLSFWSIHIFQPSLLLGERNENRAGEEVAGKIGKAIDVLTFGALTKYKPIEAAVVAKAMVNAAQLLQSGVYTYNSKQLNELADMEEDLRKMSKF